MDVYDWLGAFLGFGGVVMALSLFVTWRVAGEVRRHREMASRLEQRLAAYRHAVEVEVSRQP